ncbi:MAG: N-acyl homoserine lactonase family protein [Candidatus Binatia bacterium]
MRQASALLLCSLLVLAAGGCENYRKVPRIEARLYGWDEPFSGLEGIKLHVFTTGKIVSTEGAVFGGELTQRMELPVSSFVVEHPRAGLIVFDTGFNPAVRLASRDYLGWLLDTVGCCSLEEGQELVSQMSAVGLDPAAVSYVVLSHLHFDHSGAVESFPAATVVVSRNERRAAAAAKGLRDWFFEGDYDEVGDWLEIDYDRSELWGTFAGHHDLLGDGSVVLVDLRGHSAGSQGMVLRGAGDTILLTGDAAYVEQSWRYAAEPLIAWNMDLWWEQVWRIKKFAQLLPGLLVIPGHDQRGLEETGRPGVLRHVCADHGAVDQ